MKTVFSNNQELCHVWASGSQSYGRSHNMHWQDDRLFSYNTVIATRIRHKKRVAVVVDYATFSSNTSKHQGCARHALRGRPEPVFAIHSGRFGQEMWKWTPKTLIDWYVKRYNMAPSSSRYQHINAEGVLKRASLLDQAIEVSEFFKLGHKRLLAERDKISSDVASAHAVVSAYQAKREVQREARDLANRERRAAEYAEEVRRAVEIAEGDLSEVDLSGNWNYSPFGYGLGLLSNRPDLREKVKAEIERRSALTVTDWKNNVPYSRVPYAHSIVLRVNRDGRIETSRNAVIPYEAGERCFRFALARRTKGWQRNGEKFAVGPYQLDRVDETGIKAGCHEIDWATIEEFAKQEGWVK
jgi:hypothetical protein